MTYEKKWWFYTKNTYFSLQLVLLCRSRSSGNKQTKISHLHHPHPGDVLKPCRPSLYLERLSKWCRWHTPNRMPSRRLPLSKRELLHPKTICRAKKNIWKSRFRKGPAQFSMDIRFRRTEICTNNHRFYTKNQGTRKELCRNWNILVAHNKVWYWQQKYK